jgi:hypothetical protein
MTSLFHISSAFAPSKGLFGRITESILVETYYPRKNAFHTGCLRSSLSTQLSDANESTDSTRITHDVIDEHRITIASPMRLTPKSRQIEKHEDVELLLLHSFADRYELLRQYPLLESQPFPSERQFSSSARIFTLTPRPFDSQNEFCCRYSAHVHELLDKMCELGNHGRIERCESKSDSPWIYRQTAHGDYLWKVILIIGRGLAVISLGNVSLPAISPFADLQALSVDDRCPGG